MHLAMNASANNDPLAYVLVGGLLYLSLARATRRVSATRFLVVGGVLFSTFLTLLLVPVVYAILARFTKADRVGDEDETQVVEPVTVLRTISPSEGPTP